MGIVNQCPIPFENVSSTSVEGVSDISDITENRGYLVNCNNGGPSGLWAVQAVES